MNSSICDECRYSENEYYNKLCCNCMQWVDGYLEATNYAPKEV